MKYKKECKRCTNLFRPRTSSTKLCKECIEKSLKLRKEKVIAANKLRSKK